MRFQGKKREGKKREIEKRTEKRANKQGEKKGKGRETAVVGRIRSQRVDDGRLNISARFSHLSSAGRG